MWVLVVVLLATVTGCQTQRIVCSPTDYTGCVVDEVRVTGNKAVPDSEFTSRMATAATGGSFEGVPLIGAIDTLTVQYERFDRFVLDRDLERVARIYRAKGYYDAVVRAGRVRRIDEHKPGNPDMSNTRLLVEIVVEEGEPVRVEKVNVSYQDQLRVDDPLLPLALLRARSVLGKDDIFTEEAYEAARNSIARTLTDRGYAYATVQPSANIDIKNRKATVTYTVALGPKCTFGKVSIVGLGGLPEWQVRPALGIEENEPYSTDTLENAQVALAELGVFGSISVEPVLDRNAQPLATKVPIMVRVQVAPLGTVRLGGGIELGDQVAARGIAGWQHRNATGALDRFSIDGRVRALAYPWRISTIGSTEGRVEFVPEFGVRVQYTLPFPGDPRAQLFAQSSVSYGIKQNHDPPDVLAEGQPVPVEILLEHSQGYQRKFFFSRLLLSLSHNLSFSNPFNLYFEESAASRILISYIDVYGQLDLRKNDANKYDRVRPTKGVMISTDVQVAGFIFGGDADDVRLKPEMRWYASLAKGFVLAGRVAMGFLYTNGYGFTLDDNLETAPLLCPGQEDPNVRDACRQQQQSPTVSKDVAILTKRGFFSGGPTSNRGYGFNEISPQRVVDDNGIKLLDPESVGGRTLWEASIEFRFPIRGSWTGTTFIDASDVTRGFGELRIDHPHISTGFGVNYETPVGPLRLDLGVRVPYLQVIGVSEVENCTNDTTGPEWNCPDYIVDEGEATDIFGLPMALSIAIGNAF